MKKIAHLSDLHFGAEEPALVNGLLADLTAACPDLVAVSGDLTQRARRSQFAAARAFLDRVPAPVLVVPGNHDVPLYDLARRFLRPLDRYRAYITDDLAPMYVDDEVAVQGLNTARSNTWKSGRVSLSQMDVIRERLGQLPDSVFKVVVTHHPLVLPPGHDRHAPAGRSLAALYAAEASGTDLVLAGHLHVGYTGDVRMQHVTIRRSILVALAGTAISRRRRNGANAYNMITVEPPELTITVRAWNGVQFVPTDVARYVQRDGAWQLER